MSTVNEHSLASRVGLKVGDQLLEVCGINMRSATYELAASVLRQCGTPITMLVQYSPDSEFMSSEVFKFTNRMVQNIFWTIQVVQAVTVKVILVPALPLHAIHQSPNTSLRQS